MRLLMVMALQLSVLAWAAPCLAQAPAAGNAVVQAEISFWESVKDSKDPAELQAYLDKYPNGTFAALAKVRLERLKGTPPDAPATASPAPGSSTPSFPKVGDTWTYRYTDLWKPGQNLSVSHTVKSVGERQILDVRTSPKGSDEFLYTAQPTMVQRAGAAYEFSPYQLLFLPLKPRETFSMKFISPDYHMPWVGTVSVIREETVSVPAGTFSTMRVELRATRRINDTLATYPTQMTVVIWYASQVKRVVKYSVQTARSSSAHDRDLYELVSYTLH